MFSLKYYYKTITKHDLINRFCYKNIKHLPSFEKVNLIFSCSKKDFNFKNLAIAMFSLQLITNQKGNFAQLKKIKILIKMRKGHPVGCKISLKKKKMHEFFLNFLFNISPKLENFYSIKSKNKNQANTYSFQLVNIFDFNELEKHYSLMNNLPTLGITFVTTNTKTQKELLYLINSFKLAFFI